MQRKQHGLGKQQKLFSASCFFIKVVFFFLLFSIQKQVMAQSSLYDSVNLKRYQIAKAGFTALGSWAALNIAAGLIGQKNTTGESKQFHRSNTIGGMIDMVFAGVGYFTTRRMASQPHSIAETFKKQLLAEKVFLFSVGLDIGAVTLGMYTKERGNRFAGEKRNKLVGAGNSLMLQGAFLILFDGIMYVLQAKNGSRLAQKLQNLSFSQQGKGFGLAYRF